MTKMAKSILPAQKKRKNVFKTKHENKHNILTGDNKALPFTVVIVWDSACVVVHMLLFHNDPLLDVMKWVTDFHIFWLLSILKDLSHTIQPLYCRAKRPPGGLAHQNCTTIKITLCRDLWFISRLCPGRKWLKLIWTAISINNKTNKNTYCFDLPPCT